MLSNWNNIVKKLNWQVIALKLFFWLLVLVPDSRSCMDKTSPDLTPDQLLAILSLYKDAFAIYTGEDIIIQAANDAMIAFWGKVFIASIRLFI